VLNFNEGNLVKKKYNSVKPEYQNTLYDQRLAEQSLLLYQMNNQDPYFTVIKKLYLAHLINRYVAVILWLRYGLNIKGVNLEKAKYTFYLIIMILPKPLHLLKIKYYSMSDGNIIKRNYRKFKRIFRNRQ